MIKKILISIGGTPYTSVAVERAILIASRFDAQITGLVVLNPDYLKNTSNIKKEGSSSNHRIIMTKERVDQAISEFKSSCTSAGVKYQVKQGEQKTVTEQLISLSRYHDLMIFGLRAVFEYDLSPEPKDVVAKLISAGMGPIIAVSDKMRTIRKVLIFYDGSIEAAKSMKRFVQLRLWSDVLLKVVTFRKSEEEARQLSIDASEYCEAHGFNVEREYNPGHPKNLLIPMAALWQADMIVLPGTEHSLTTQRVFRETTLHIIRDADIPLFVGR